LLLSVVQLLGGAKERQRIDGGREPEKDGGPWKGWQNGDGVTWIWPTLMEDKGDLAVEEVCSVEASAPGIVLGG